MFLKRKVSVKSVQSYTISRFSTCVDTGKNSGKHTLLCLSSVCFSEFFPVSTHVENREMVYFHADFSLKKKLFDKLILFVIVRWSLNRYICDVVWFIKHCKVCEKLGWKHTILNWNNPVTWFIFNIHYFSIYIYFIFVWLNFFNHVRGTQMLIVVRKNTPEKGC